MARFLLPSIVCIGLCPLLIALPVAAETPQHPAQVATSAEKAKTLPLPASLVSIKGRKIQLVAQEPISMEMAQIGAPFQFVVDKDVVVDGVTLIHAGTPVIGVIAKVNRGSYERNRDGYLDLRLSEPAGGPPIRVHLSGIPPEQVQGTASGHAWNGSGLQIVDIVLLIVGAMVLLAVRNM
jgi:hypothetical protein